MPISVHEVEHFRVSKVDITLLLAFAMENLRCDPNRAIQWQKIPPLAVTYLTLNLKDSVMSKPDVRRALNIAIDRDALLKGVLKGQGSAAQGVIPPLLNAYDKNLPFTHDSAAAKALLTSAGYADGLQLDV